MNAFKTAALADSKSKPSLLSATSRPLAPRPTALADNLRNNVRRSAGATGRRPIASSARPSSLNRDQSSEAVSMYWVSINFVGTSHLRP